MAGLCTSLLDLTPVLVTFTIIDRSMYFYPLNKYYFVLFYKQAQNEDWPQKTFCNSEKKCDSQRPARKLTPDRSLFSYSTFYRWRAELRRSF